MITLPQSAEPKLGSLSTMIWISWALSRWELTCALESSEQNDIASLKYIRDLDLKNKTITDHTRYNYKDKTWIYIFLNNKTKFVWLVQQSVQILSGGLLTRKENQ